MSRIILFNKPYLVLCQFTDTKGRRTLADHIPIPAIYPAGRLDYDSEGLLILTDSGTLQHSITDPYHKFPKTYWVQVEGQPEASALQQLEGGVVLKDGPARSVRVKPMTEPQIWPRTPPIRYRKEIPTSWIELTLMEGRKRQVRRMTAAIGYPTLRLIRVAIGKWKLGELQPGEWVEVT